MAEKYTVLMVDPEADNQNKFKTVAKEVYCFEKIIGCGVLDDALGYALSAERAGVIVVSYRFRDDARKNFINRLRQTEKGQDWVVVALLKPSGDTADTINYVIGMGMNGFVFEPYSVDNLKDLEPLAKKLKLDNQQIRLRYSLEILFMDIAKHLDAVAFLTSSGKNPSIANTKLNESCAGLQNFRSQLSAGFFDVAARTFAGATPFGGAYSGPSRRVAERLKERAIAEIERKYTS